MAGQSIREMNLSSFIDQLSIQRKPLRFSGAEEKKPVNQYDLVIIGAGPAGVTAAIYAVRRKLKTLLLDKAPVIGGYVANTSVVENYPSTYSTSGKALAQEYADRLNGLNSEASGLKGYLDIRLGESVMKVSEKEAGGFEIALDQNKEKFDARAVIVATGVNRKKVPIKGFQEMLNKGVSLCTICDGPLYQGKDVAVIGHNQAAVDAALYMANIGRSVYFVSSKPIEASAESLAALRAKPTVREVLESTAVTEFQGTERLTAMVVKDKNGPARTIPIQGAFLETDLVSSAKFASGLVALDGQGQVFVDDDLNAGAKGLFAAGDVTPIKFKQITIAEGQGAIAALKAAEYLQGQDIKTDYGKNPLKKPNKPPVSEGTTQPPTPETPPEGDS